MTTIMSHGCFARSIYAKDKYVFYVQNNWHKQTQFKLLLVLADILI